MLPECQICWFCVHKKSEIRQGKRCSRVVRYCDLGVKNLKAERRQDFSRCKFFESNAEAIRERQMELHRVIRDCRVELGYLDRLESYMEHRRRRGAFYQKEHAYYEPLLRAEDDGKTDSAVGFEKGEKQ